MLLTSISWAKRVWAFPFLTVLAPSERYALNKGIRHKKLTDWARQMLLQVKRWLPSRQVIAVGDSSYAVLELLAALQGKVTVITRLRLDAALYEPAPSRPAGKRGPNRKKGQRLATLQQVAEQPATQWQELTFSEWYGQNQKTMEIATGTAIWYHSGKPPVAIRWVRLRDPQGKLDTTALLSTKETLVAEQIVTYFVRRWTVEVTFQEVRAHLGVETQRQWSGTVDEQRIRSKSHCSHNSSVIGIIFYRNAAGQSLTNTGMLANRYGRLVRKTAPHFQ